MLCGERSKLNMYETVVQSEQNLQCVVSHDTGRFVNTPSLEARLFKIDNYQQAIFMHFPIISLISTHIIDSHMSKRHIQKRHIGKPVYKNAIEYSFVTKQIKLSYLTFLPHIYTYSSFYRPPRYARHATGHDAAKHLLPV